MNAKAPSKVTFVAKESDLLAVQFVRAVQKEGHAAQIMPNGDSAPAGSVVFYTSQEWDGPHNHVRTAAHHLMDDRPDWARTTPFVIAIRDRHADAFDLANAATQIADQYIRWLGGVSGSSLPWVTPHEKVPTTYKKQLNAWLGEVADVIGDERLANLLQGKEILLSQQGRGGDVVFRQLFMTGRIALSPSDIPVALRGNRVFTRLTGIKGPVVNYGKSDIANVFEFLQTLKLAQFLGLPAAFDTYPGAHNLGYWLDGFLNPSLKLLGVSLKAEDLGLTRQSKYTEQVSAEALDRFVERAGLTTVRDDAHMQETSIESAKWYEHALTLLGQEFQKLLGTDIRCAFTSTEALIGSTAWWKKSAISYATQLEEEAGHPVVALRDPQGREVMTDTIKSWRSTGKMDFSKSLAELHTLGWWLGGAGIYRSVFSLGEQGGFVCMVKDGSAGQVNLLARPFLRGESDLYMSPVGLFRLTAEGQKEDWSIDPWVLLHLLRLWGPEKAAIEARKIWEAMEVSLAVEHVGRKTIATVSTEGVTVTVTEPK